jgi:hypothetical protein
MVCLGCSGTQCVAQATLKSCDGAYKREWGDEERRELLGAGKSDGQFALGEGRSGKQYAASQAVSQGVGVCFGTQLLRDGVGGQTGEVKQICGGSRGRTRNHRSTLKNGNVAPFAAALPCLYQATAAQLDAATFRAPLENYLFPRMVTWCTADGVSND